VKNSPCFLTEKIVNPGLRLVLVVFIVSKQINPKYYH